MNGYLSPPQYAKRLGIKPEKVLQWIRNGELRAIDVSSCPGVGRPRYRIPADAVVEFEETRSGLAPNAKPRRRKRKRLPNDFVRYF